MAVASSSAPPERATRPNILQPAGDTAAGAAQAAGTDSSNSNSGVCERNAEEHVVVGHRGSGGLVRGRAVFCLPPEVEWFQGHFAYAARGGCTASLGVLGTELPVDAVSDARVLLILHTYSY